MASKSYTIKQITEKIQAAGYKVEKLTFTGGFSKQNSKRASQNRGGTTQKRENTYVIYSPEGKYLGQVSSLTSDYKQDMLRLTIGGLSFYDVD